MISYRLQVSIRVYRHRLFDDGSWGATSVDAEQVVYDGNAPLEPGGPVQEEAARMFKALVDHAEAEKEWKAQN